MEITLAETVRELQKVTRNFREFCHSDRIIRQHSEVYISKRLNSAKKEAMSRFTIHYNSIPQNLFKMTLDFNPLIKAYKLDPFKESFILCHWNTGPRVPHVRMGEYGFYCANKGDISYKIVPHEIVHPAHVLVNFLQVERTDVLPTAVILMKDCILEEHTEGFILNEI